RRLLPRLRQVMSDIEDIAKRVSTFTVNLSTAERMSQLKMRMGGERVIAIVGQLADQHSVALPDISASTSPTIEASLRPVVTFFSLGPRKKGAGGGPGAVVAPPPDPSTTKSAA